MRPWGATHHVRARIDGARRPVLRPGRGTAVVVPRPPCLGQPGPILGQAFDTWQAVSPAQLKFTDRRTGEVVDLMFAFRARTATVSTVLGLRARFSSFCDSGLFFPRYGIFACALHDRL